MAQYRSIVRATSKKIGNCESVSRHFFFTELKMYLCILISMPLTGKLNGIHKDLQIA